MTDQFAQPAAPGAPHGGQAPSPPPRDPGELLRSLRRSRSNRVIAGVAGGLARELRVDPILVRVILVALVFVSGAGLLIYAIAWLLVPDESDDMSVVDHALGGRPSQRRTSSLLLGAGLILMSVAVVASASDGDFGGLILFGLLAFGIAYLLRRGELPRQVSQDEYAPQPVAPTAQAEPTAPGPYAAAATQSPYEPQPQPAWTPPPPAWEAPPPRPVKPRKEPSQLTAIVLSALLVVLGSMAVIDVAWADIPAAAYFATALFIVGAGLVAGTWFGRGRGLILLGTLLAVALPLATAADEVSRGVDGEWGDITVTPQTLADIPASEEFGGAGVIYDLSQVPFAETTDKELKIDLGVGELQVIVPENVDVHVDAGIGLGEINLFGVESGGVGLDKSATDYGPDGPGGGTLRLDLSGGGASLEVTR